MKIALVHDYLAQDGGAERVFMALHELWPEAPMYTLLFDRANLGAKMPGDVRTSFLQRIPFSATHYRWLMPMMPAATESFDLRGYDVVVSSTSAFAKGILTDPGTIHICYCHTPPRYLWSDRQDYTDNAAPWAVRPMMPFLSTKLRAWDKAAADRVDHFITNSNTVAKRISKYYRKDSEIIYPPVDTAKFSYAKGLEGHYFLAGGRLVAYKRFDLIVAAFNALGMPLKIFGEGTELSRLRRYAWNNIQFLGRINDEEKAELYAGAAAYIHPQEEDFGITAVEAMAAGTPVIAYRQGGATETIIDGVTGMFFDEQSADALVDAVLKFDGAKFDRAAIRAHARQYDTEIFKMKMREVVERIGAK